MLPRHEVEREERDGGATEVYFLPPAALFAARCCGDSTELHNATGRLLASTVLYAAFLGVVGALYTAYVLGVTGASPPLFVAGLVGAYWLFALVLIGIIIGSRMHYLVGRPRGALLTLNRQGRRLECARPRLVVDGVLRVSFEPRSHKRRDGEGSMSWPLLRMRVESDGRRVVLVFGGSWPRPRWCRQLEFVADQTHVS